MTITFDSAVKAAGWWAVYDCNPNAQMPPAYVPAAGTEPAHIEVDFAPTGGVVAVTTGFQSKTAMDAVLTYAAATLVNCFDTDPALRGRYSKVGGSGTGSWSRVGNIADKAWPDPNHVERLLELIMCSWINTSPAAPGAGPPLSWVSPSGEDWSAARVTFNMRAKDLYLGPWAKICQHVQGDVPALSALLPRWLTFTAQPVNDTTIVVNGTTFTFKASGATGNQINKGATLADTLANAVTVLNASVVGGVAEAEYSATATVLTAISNVQDGTPFTLTAGTSGAAASWSNAFPNFIFTKSLISDQLGFGTDSWGVANRVPYVEDSGPVNVVLEYSADDDDWECLGTVERPVSFFHYVNTSIAAIITSLFGNSYMMVVHDKPQVDADHWDTASALGIAEADRIRGQLRFYSITVEVFTP